MEIHKEELFDIVFGIEHIIAEFFWNFIFVIGTFLFTKAVALRKIHKYVDDKHGISHEEKEY